MFKSRHSIHFLQCLWMFLLMAFPLWIHGENSPNSNSTRIQAIVFDFGGVIVEANRNEVIRFIVAEFKVTEQEAKDVLVKFKSYWINGGNEKEFWENYAQEKEIILPKDWFQQWHSTLLHSLKEIPGIIEIIQGLKKQGFIIALLSNVRKEQAEYIRSLGYYDLFQPALLSYEMGCEKPDPRIFQILLSELNLSPDVCLFIDDKKENVEAAKTLGIDSIQFFNVQLFKEELTQRNISFSLPKN
jgi:epoxide hydrolase-like predicted phosphatase